jgi:hypothetical protein
MHKMNRPIAAQANLATLQHPEVSSLARTLPHAAPATCRAAGGRSHEHSHVQRVQHPRAAAPPSAAPSHLIAAAPAAGRRVSCTMRMQCGAGQMGRA